MKRSRGFTLIELLVAIGILAIVAVLGWRGLDAIIRTRLALNTELEQTRGLQLAFAQMQSDCQHIANAADIGGRTVIAAQQGVLVLARVAYAENQPSRIQVVTYRVRDGVLSRSESVPTRDLASFDAAWSAALSDADSTQRIALKNNVASMTVRSWVTNGNAWIMGVNNPSSTTVQAPAPQSGQTPPPAQQAGNRANTVPLTGLEVTLGLQGRAGSLRKIFLLGAA